MHSTLHPGACVKECSLRDARVSLAGPADIWDNNAIACVKDVYTKKAHIRAGWYHAELLDGQWRCCWCGNSYTGSHDDVTTHEVHCTLRHLTMSAIGHAVETDAAGVPRVVLTFPPSWFQLSGTPQRLTADDDSMPQEHIEILINEVARSAAMWCKVDSDMPLPPDYEAVHQALAARDAKWKDCHASASQVIRAYRAEIAAHTGKTSKDLKAAINTLKQVRYEADIAELKEQGVNLEDNYYVPEVHPVTGHPVVCLEDNVHKHKNEGTAVRRQQDGDVSEKGISKQRLLSAVDGNKSLAEIKLFLHSKVDDQNVPIVENFFTSILLRKDLIERGFWRDVAWMIVFSEAYQAFELSGLDHADRNDRLDVQRRLLSAAIFADVHDVHCAHAHGTAQLFGFPRRLMMVLLENIDGRQHILDTYADAHRKLVERSGSTDDLELEFALIVMRCACVPCVCVLPSVSSAHMHACILIPPCLRTPSQSACVHACVCVRACMHVCMCVRMCARQCPCACMCAWHCSCGYKPTMAALLGAIANIDRLAAFRRDCERGFSLAMSTKSNQCQSDFFLKKWTLAGSCR